MAERVSGVKASVGFASETGPRERNEDFGGAVFGWELPKPRRDVVAADRRRHWRRQGRPYRRRNRGARLSRRLLRPARDHGGAPRRGDRHQLAQRLDLFPRPARPGARRHGLHLHRARAARADRACAACRRHAAPIGWAAIAWRCLTTDHVREGTTGSGRSNILFRALGVETEVRLDYATQPVALHDRFLLCSDGVHGSLAARSHRRHPARALGVGRFRARAGRRRARCRLDRQLHRPGDRRGRAADGGIGRGRRRRHHATAADPDADRRRDGRRLSC